MNNPTPRQDRKSLQECREWLEQQIAYAFARQPHMSGDQRKRLNSRELEAVQEVAEKLAAHINAMEQTLRFYADERNWDLHAKPDTAWGQLEWVYSDALVEDEGAKARACLQGLEGSGHENR